MSNLDDSLLSHLRTARNYRAIMLRCTRVENHNGASGDDWRFSVEEVFDDRQQKHFNNIEALVEFLKSQFEE